MQRELNQVKKARDEAMSRARKQQVLEEVHAETNKQMHLLRVERDHLAATGGLSYPNPKP